MAELGIQGLESKWTRERAIKQVQRAKLKMLDEGWKAFGWRSGERIPQELIKFIRACASPAGSPTLPAYSSLVALLGGDPSQSTKDAEGVDLGEFKEHVMKLL